MSAEPAAATASPPPLAVELVYAAAPHDVLHLTLTLPEGATLWQALTSSGLAERLGLELGACRASGRAAGLAIGIWGRLAGVDTVLVTGDRVELYRPLQVDPKEARRLRYRRDGLKQKVKGAKGAKPSPRPR